MGWLRGGLRGAMHFEMVVSFIFFMGFVFFLFVVLKPYSSSTLDDFVVAGIHDALVRNASVSLTTFFLQSSHSTPLDPADCFSVELAQNLFSEGLVPSTVVGLSSGVVPSKIAAVDVDMAELKIIGDDSFYEVSFSDEFLLGSVGVSCTPLLSFTWGNIITRKVLSNSSLVALKELYDTDYGSAREVFGVPAIFDFALVSKDLEEVSMEALLPETGEIVAREYGEGVLYANGTVVPARFVIYIW